MAYTAKWKSKGFLISPNKVVPFENLKTSFALKTDTNSDTSGTPSTNTLGRELQEITFETMYSRALGTDPRAQIEDWNANIGGIDTLYIKGKPFGADKLQLIKVDVTETKLSATGEFLSVRLALTFKEYQSQAAAISTKPKTGGTTSTATKTTTNNGKQLNKVAALSAKASSDDKARIASTRQLPKATTK